MSIMRWPAMLFLACLAGTGQAQHVGPRPLAGDAQAACLNAAGDGARIQAAVDTGRNVHITGPCLGDTTVTVSANGQEIFGDGPENTVITVSAAVAGDGTFKCNTGTTNQDVGPVFRDLGITFVQVNTDSRASLVNFKPAFSCRNTPWGKIERVRVKTAMVGVDIIGQSGGFRISDLEISCISVCIHIDGSTDSIKLTRLHIWPFSEGQLSGGCGGASGWTGLCVIYSAPNASGTPRTTSGVEGPIGLLVGRMDDLHLSDSLILIGQGMKTYTGVGAGIGAATGSLFANITNTDFDTYGGIILDSGIISASTVFFSAITSDYGSLNIVAGQFRCASCWFNNGGTAGSVPIVQVRMVPNDVAVPTSLMLSNVEVDMTGLDASFLQAELGGNINIQGMLIRSTVETSAVPLICAPCVDSGTLSANISGVQPTNAVTSRILIESIRDGYHRIIGNGLRVGWANVCAATQTLMRTGFNGTAANATCN